MGPLVVTQIMANIPDIPIIIITTIPEIPSFLTQLELLFWHSQHSCNWPIGTQYYYRLCSSNYYYSYSYSSYYSKKKSRNLNLNSRTVQVADRPC